MTYGLCAWCRAGHMTPANWCKELTLLSEAESSLSSSPFRLRGSRAAHEDSACKHKSSQKSQAPEAPIASLDKSYAGGGMWSGGEARLCSVPWNRMLGTLGTSGASLLGCDSIQAAEWPLAFLSLMEETQVLPLPHTYLQGCHLTPRLVEEKLIYERGKQNKNKRSK